MKILVCCSHPDDESLGMGGTIARLVSEGHTVFVQMFTDGVGARRANDREARMQRRREHGAALNVLGAVPAELGRLGPFPDNAMDGVPLLDVVRDVERTLAAVQPEVVYTHHAGDLNVDHRIVHQAVVTATRPQPGQTVRRVLAFEVPSSTEWAFGATGPAFTPNVFVPLTEAQVEQKVRAWKCYASEYRPHPHPRSLRGVEALAWVRGVQCGHEYAEAFMLVREVVP